MYVEDFPSQKMMRDLGIRYRAGLCGLYLFVCCVVGYYDRNEAELYGVYIRIETATLSGFVVVDAHGIAIFHFTKV